MTFATLMSRLSNGQGKENGAQQLINDEFENKLSREGSQYELIRRSTSSRMTYGHFSRYQREASFIYLLYKDAN